jgi:chromosome segregation ATPase
VYGTATAIGSAAMQVQASNLRTRGNKLNGELDNLRTEIEVLGGQFSELERQRTGLDNTICIILQLQLDCAELRNQSQNLASELLRAQMVLSQIKIKLDLVATELMKCEYKRTRRDIGFKLRDIVNDIQCGGIGSVPDSMLLAGVLRNLDALDGNRHNVLTILHDQKLRID